MMLQQSARVTQADIDSIRMAPGLDRPFLVQYMDFMHGLLTGDLGKSFFRGPVSGLIATALPAAILLAVTSLLISLVFSVPLGVYAATHRGKIGDQLTRIFSLVGLSFPNFRLGIVLVLLFSVTLGWLPVSGYTGSKLSDYRR